jgi:hypothetical protein
MERPGKHRSFVPAPGEIHTEDVSSRRQLAEFEATAPVGPRALRSGISSVTDILRRHHLDHNVNGRLTSRLPDRPADAQVEPQFEIGYEAATVIPQLDRPLQSARREGRRRKRCDLVRASRQPEFVATVRIGPRIDGALYSARGHKDIRHRNRSPLAGRRITFPVVNGAVKTCARMTGGGERLQKAKIVLGLRDGPRSGTDAGYEPASVFRLARIHKVTLTHVEFVSTSRTAARCHDAHGWRRHPTEPDDVFKHHTNGARDPKFARSKRWSILRQRGDAAGRGREHRIYLECVLTGRAGGFTLTRPDVAKGDKRQDCERGPSNDEAGDLHHSLSRRTADKHLNPCGRSRDSALKPCTVERRLSGPLAVSLHERVLVIPSQWASILVRQVDLHLSIGYDDAPDVVEFVRVHPYLATLDDALDPRENE